MAKKKSWFNLVKRFFIWETHSTQEKKERKRKWVFGRLKSKRLPSITAPPPPSKETALSETEEEQRKQSNHSKQSKNRATAVEVVAEVVLLTEVSKSAHQCQENSEESETVQNRDSGPQSIYQCKRDVKESAAIKIQTAFRGYLAKKALRALKGIVKLQAIIRGRAVRRQAMSTLKCLQSIVSIQSKVCARRCQMVEGRWAYTENEEMQDSKDKIIRMDSNSERKWDHRTLLKEEEDSSFISKKEASLRREKIKEYYSFNHRRSAETERSKVNGRWRYWLDQWVDTQLSKSKELEDLDSVFSSHYRTGEEHGGRKLKLRSTQRQNPVEGLDSPSIKTFPHRRQCSVGEDHHSFSSSSPATPAYMAATESARAKARSTSSPKARAWNLDMNSDSHSPCKKKLPIVSSANYQQRSPSFKGLSVPIKSSRTSIKDLSINSDCSSLPTWDRQWSFK